MSIDGASAAAARARLVPGIPNARGSLQDETQGVKGTLSGRADFRSDLISFLTVRGARRVSERVRVGFCRQTRDGEGRDDDAEGPAHLWVGAVGWHSRRGDRRRRFPVEMCRHRDHGGPHLPYLRTISSPECPVCPPAAPRMPPCRSASSRRSWPAQGFSRIAPAIAPSPAKSTAATRDPTTGMGTPTKIPTMPPMREPATRSGRASAPACLRHAHRYRQKFNGTAQGSQDNKCHDNPPTDSSR